MRSRSVYLLMLLGVFCLSWLIPTAVFAGDLGWNPKEGFPIKGSETPGFSAFYGGSINYYFPHIGEVGINTKGDPNRPHTILLNSGRKATRYGYAKFGGFRYLLGDISLGWGTNDGLYFRIYQGYKHKQEGILEGFPKFAGSCPSDLDMVQFGSDLALIENSGRNTKKIKFRIYNPKDIRKAKWKKKWKPKQVFNLKVETKLKKTIDWVEAALFNPRGTVCNLVLLIAQTRNSVANSKRKVYQEPKYELAGPYKIEAHVYECKQQENGHWKLKDLKKNIISFKANTLPSATRAPSGNVYLYYGNTKSEIRYRKLTPKGWSKESINPKFKNIKTVIPPIPAYAVGDVKKAKNSNRKEMVRDIDLYLAYGEAFNFKQLDTRSFYKRFVQGPPSFKRKYVKRKFGQIKFIPNYEQIDLQKESRKKTSDMGKQVVMGIIDGPFPAPHQNIEQAKEAVRGSIVYGRSKGSTQEHKTSWTKQVGVKTQADLAGVCPVLRAGVGPAWEIAVKGGGGKAWGNSKTRQFSYSVEQKANMENNKMVNMGTLLLAGVTLHRDAYQFIDENGKVDNNTPEVSMVYPTFSKGVSSYELFAPHAGDLESYTVSGWDKTMGIGYVNNVIIPNAISFHDTNGDEVKYLSFSWSSNSGYSENFHEITRSFKEGHWTFSSEAYAGIKAKFSGMKVSDMVGMEFKSNSSRKTTDSKEWGVETKKLYVPASSASGTVYAYNWRMYLLKPNKKWTTELLNGLPKKPLTMKKLKNAIDENSEPWKICYVVTYIQYNEPVSEVDGISRDEVKELQKAGYPTIANVLAEKTDQEMKQENSSRKSSSDKRIQGKQMDMSKKISMNSSAPKLINPKLRNIFKKVRKAIEKKRAKFLKK